MRSMSRFIVGPNLETIALRARGDVVPATNLFTLVTPKARAASVRVTDVANKELPKTRLRAVAGGADERWHVRRDGNELVHATALFVLRTACR
jgi:hypothetical protein